MPRPKTTPAQRAKMVTQSAAELPNLITLAVQAMEREGPDDPRTIRAWELVEAHGATVHRQARLLAGKSKGG